MTQPTDLAELFAICSVHIEAVEHELWDFSAREQVFRGVADIVKANPEIDRPSVFYDLLVGSFAHYCMATVRRLVDRRPDSLSLWHVVKQLEQHRRLVTRDAWVSWAAEDESKRFGLDDATELATDTFLTFADEAGAELSKAEVRDLMGRLGKATDRIKDFAHKYVAHHADKRELGDLKFAEIFDAMAEVRRIFQRCVLIVKYSGAEGEVTIQEPWEQLFTVPWIRRRDDEEMQ